MKRNEWGRNVVAELCVMFLLLSGLTLCFCTHKGACESACDESDSSAMCLEICACTETAHDHVVVAMPDVVLVGEKFVLASDNFGFLNRFDFIVGISCDNRRRSGFGERERGDDYAIALVRLTRRLC